MPQWVRWLVRLALIVLAGLIVWQLAGVVITILLGLLIAAALRPIVNFLERHRVPRLAGIFVCYLFLAAILAGLVAYIIPIGIKQAAEMSRQFSTVVREFTALESQWESWRRVLPILPPAKALPAMLGPSTGKLATGFVGAAGKAFTLFVRTISAFLLSFFFLYQGGAILTEVLRLFPVSVRHQAPPMVDRMGDQVGLYALGQFVEMLIVGILDGLGMALLGVHFPVLLGVLAAISDVIPYFGPIIAAVPAVLVGTSQSPWLGLYALGVYALVHVLEANLLNPYVVGRFVGLRPVWVVVAVLIGDAVLGIPGMALAIPAATVIRIAIREVYLPWLQGTAD